MLNETPIDYVIFGNHEDDLEHVHVCQRNKDYKGTWLNSNMQEHEMFKAGYQKATDIITVTSPDGSNSRYFSHSLFSFHFPYLCRSVGLLAVLSDSPGLYKKNAFAGAKIEDPYDTIEKYKNILEKESKVDLVIPLCHLYVPQVRFHSFTLFYTVLHSFTQFYTVLQFCPICTGFSCTL